MCVCEREGGRAHEGGSEEQPIRCVWAAVLQTALNIQYPGCIPSLPFIPLSSSLASLHRLGLQTYTSDLNLLSVCYKYWVQIPLGSWAALSGWFWLTCCLSGLIADLLLSECQCVRLRNRKWSHRRGNLIRRGINMKRDIVLIRTPGLNKLILGKSGHSLREAEALEMQCEIPGPSTLEGCSHEPSYTHSTHKRWRKRWTACDETCDETLYIYIYISIYLYIFLPTVGSSRPETLCSFWVGSVEPSCPSVHSELSNPLGSFSWPRRITSQ